MAKLKRIGLLGFDGVAAIDLVGVLDTFYVAGGNDWRKRSALYETITVGLSARAFRAESGLRMVPDATLKDAPAFDTIVVPGGRGCAKRRSTPPSPHGCVPARSARGASCRSAPGFMGWRRADCLMGGAPRHIGRMPPTRRGAFPA